VYRNDQLWNAAYGILDKSTLPAKTPNEDTLYRTGSLVKLLTVYNVYFIISTLIGNRIIQPGLSKYFSAKFNPIIPYPACMKTFDIKEINKMKMDLTDP
jgi:hypothetical protein